MNFWSFDYSFSSSVSRLLYMHSTSLFLSYSQFWDSHAYRETTFESLLLLQYLENMHDVGRLNSLGVES
jgi:hypothetical protein